MLTGRSSLLLAVSALFIFACSSFADDYFLTIGGGYSPAGNQASLEKNVRLFQRTLHELNLNHQSVDLYFSDGSDSDLDVQVIDRDSVPKANRLMAEFFGRDDNLGLSYRDHQVPDVRGAANPANIRQWFEKTGSGMQAGDRLVLYVTAHGYRSADRRNQYNTSIAMWNNTAVTMVEFVRLLDELPQGVEVVAVMVQCYAGGFARFIFNDGDPDRGLSAQRRCGFFATVHDRPAAGCTPEIDEASYVEYSTYFWAALTGRDRGGRAIELPDYNKDGVVSFSEAHAYTMLTAHTIDVPVTTSSEYLDVNSRFGSEDSTLLTDEEPYEVVLNLATPAETAVLEGLSEQLGLTGSNRLSVAERETRPQRGRGRSRGRRRDDPGDKLRREIADDLRDRWPELANVLNPVAVELLTSRSAEFIAAVEEHPDYKRYRTLSGNPPADNDGQKHTAKYERFLRTADNVLLAENLRRIGDLDQLEQYNDIVRAEAGSLTANQ